METNPDPGIPFAVQLLFLLFLILVNAFFAMAEMALVSSNKNLISGIAREGNKKAQIVEKLLEEPNKFLSTVQVIITLAGFLASAAAAVGISDDLEAYFNNNGWPYSEQIAVFLVTIVLAYVTLVLGELYPKRIAMQHSEKIAMFVARPLKVMSVITRPFVWLLSVSVNFFLKITGQKTKTEDEGFSEEEVMSMLETGQEKGALKEEGKRMINSIFAFDDKLAYEIMTPRTDVFMINIKDPTEEYIDELMELRYSRIPVYDDDNDNIKGIVHIKDYLIKAREEGFENVDIKAILREPYFVPETKNIDTLFFELQKTKQHIALLIDEYGGFSGIVTMEDIIEEVMGEIDDEYDMEEPKIEKIDDENWQIDGTVYLDDINEELGTDFKSENSETISGLLIEKLGEIPEDSDHENITVDIENYSFIIESVKDRRIEKVRLKIMPTFEADREEKRQEDE
ncbi:MAG TPA: hemolysin family protein [Bacillota bacterium]|nr:hemolysin family protein [Bacillota bacterium]HUM55791.1 hemolysin family protein [Bacillota bacterium]